MNPSILIVEDEFIVSAEIAERLRDMGYRIAGSTDSGEQVIELVHQQRPDLVLMDIRLRGEMDGIATAQEIRQRFHLPVIFLTAYSEDATLERAKLAGPYGYILKPFDDRELKSTVEIALYRHRAEEEIRRLNRLYDVLSQVNQAVVRLRFRDELFATVCRLIVERGAVDMAWIDWFDPETARMNTIARFGERSELLRETCRSADDHFADQYIWVVPQAETAVACNTLPQDCPRAGSCAAFGLEFQSCGSFPIHFQGRVSGALRLGVSEPDFFQEREVELLKEVALDISFAIDKIEADACRERAERELRRSEAKFRSYIEHAPLGVFVADRTGHFREVNSAAAMMLGYNEAELTGLSIPDILAAQSLESGLRAFHTVVETGSATGQYRFRHQDGSRLWASVSAVKIDDNLFLAFCQDITEQRQAVEMRLESQEKLRLFIEHAPASLAMFDRKMRYLSASRRWLTDYHLGDRDLTGLSHYEVFPEVTEYWKEIHRRGLSGEVVRADNDRFDRADGSTQWLRWEVRPWRMTTGEVGGVLIFSEDITDRKKIEEAVAEQERYLRTILQTTVDGFWVVDAEGRFVEVNDAYCRMCGYTRVELLRMRISDIEAIEAPADVGARIARVTVSGSESFETRHRRKNGSVFDVQVSVTHLNVGTSQFVCFCRDITEKKQDEAALRESEEQFKAMFDMASIGIAQADPHSWILLRTNQKLSEITGYCNNELIGMSIQQMTHPEDRERDWETFQNVLSNKTKEYRLEKRYLRKDGTTVWVNVNMTLIRDSAGQPIRTLAMIEDITARKQMEEEQARADMNLRQVQKMEAIGHLAGGIAHDFNNILSAILGYTEMALDEVPDASVVGDDLKEVLTAGLRAKELVKQILTFSRHTEREPKPIEITYIVKEAAKMLKAMLPATITIHSRIDLEPSSRVLGDPTEIHQVIMNLCTNAAHAMRANGGDLDIALKETVLRDDAPRLHPDLAPGKYIQLCVTDTGHGMSETIAAQIFNPFFTTKPQGEGTGMGLSVVHGIVQSCNGAITVESQEGAGSRICVYLPGLKIDTMEMVQDSPSYVSGKGCILFVDDEEPIIGVVQPMLERMGYSVTTSGNGREALEIIASHPCRFDLLVTDYTMPRMTGLELAKEAGRIRPGLPVIVCSGHNDTLNENTAASFGIAAYIPKPFDRHTLSRAIEKALAGK